MGISAAGSGTANTISGVFAQTPTRRPGPRIGPTTSDLDAGERPRRGWPASVLANFHRGTSVGKNYTILTATGGYTGTFNALATQNMAGLPQRQPELRARPA